MEKIVNFFKNILLTIVYPNRLLTLFRVKNLDQNSNRILGNDTVLRSLAFIGAVVFVITVRYTPAAAPTTYNETVTVALTRTIDADNYTYFGSPIPSSIDIILSGDRTAVELFVASGELAANLDLQGHEPGTHDGIGVDIIGVPTGITATPSVGIINGIIIDVVATETFRVTPFSRLPEIPIHGRYAISDIRVYPEYVTITGPQRFIAVISEVQVPFDIRDVNVVPGTVNREGIVTAQDATLNNITGGLYFHQPIVQVEIEFYENTRTLPITYQNPTNVPSGYRATIIAEFDEIQVWGDFESLPSSIMLPRFSFDDLDEDGRIVIIIPLPQGLYSETVEVELVVIIEEITGVFGRTSDEP